MQLGITHLPLSDLISSANSRRDVSRTALHQLARFCARSLPFKWLFQRRVISDATLEMRYTHGCLINCLLSLQINVRLCVWCSGRTSLIMHVFGVRLLKMQLSSYALLRNSKHQALVFIRINYVLASFKHTLSTSQILRMLEKLVSCKLVDFVLDPGYSSSS
jgi:hypothetical protein